MSVFDQFAGMEASVNVKIPTHAEVFTAARHVLYTLDGDKELGQEPGGFTSSLILLACHADRENLAKLALGFPSIITAVDLYKNNVDGVALLRRLASKTPDIHPDSGSPKEGNSNG